MQLRCFPTFSEKVSCHHTIWYGTFPSAQSIAVMANWIAGAIKHPGALGLATVCRDLTVARHLDMTKDMAVRADRDQIGDQSILAVPVDVVNDKYLFMRRIPAVIAALFERFPSILAIASRPTLFDLPLSPARKRAVDIPAIRRNEERTAVGAELLTGDPTLRRASFGTKTSALVGTAIFRKKLLSAVFTSLQTMDNWLSLVFPKSQVMAMLEFSARIRWTFSTSASACNCHACQNTIMDVSWQIG